jgi:hypothetical protein
MIKKKYLIMFVIFLTLNILFFFPLVNKHLLTALIYLKISKNVIVENSIENTLENLHNFIIFNVDKNLDSKYYPVFDKYTYNSLIDGYTDCSGSAAIYLWILMFLNINSELVPLYDNEYKKSPHTILSAHKKNKSFIIDPFYKFTFFNENLDFAKLNDICDKKINTKQLNLLNNEEYKFFENFCFTKKSSMRASYKIPPFIFTLIEYIPNFYIDFVIKNSINIKYYNNNYLKGRIYYIIGEYEKALKAFNKVQESQISYYDFFLGIDEKVNDYEINNLKKLSVQDLVIYYKALINIKINNQLYYGDFNNNHLDIRYLNFLKSYNLQNYIQNIN